MPDGDQVAGVDLVVIGKAQPLDLLVDRQAQLVGGVMADRFAPVVLQHGEDAARDADGEQDHRRGPERGAGRDAVIEHALGLIDRLTEEAWHQQLQTPRQ